MKIYTYIVAILLVISGELDARRSNGNTHVRSHIRKDGHYVNHHYRTNPSRMRPRDNWSTKGNVNPYTGKKGY